MEGRLETPGTPPGGGGGGGGPGPPKPGIGGGGGGGGGILLFSGLSGRTKYPSILSLVDPNLQLHGSLAFSFHMICRRSQ